ncbi:MFS transporter [Microvirga alba]|uniref:MFS transporter n=1 Tax=Microvirga alba TaxID=2791025 RepID=A0A931BWB0_9HYPH|nr:MFS transporter [Microvirga alba]MBF9234002.1 MFS transporter [Microvirga alba]
MSMRSDLRELTPQQRKVIVASFLGWTLDAFDFFLLVFVLKDIAQEFSTTIESVTIAILLTLAMRPIGALLFGLAADRWGRRPTLMANILLYSGVEFASGLAPSLMVLIILRAIYGIAMGGEWGVGASLAMESIPPKIRGLISGVLQAGYPTGYLIASLVFFLLYSTIGWRGMFFVGAAPALLVLYIRSHVEESPVFLARQLEEARPTLWQVMRGNLRLAIWAILLMTAFNFFSHGTQDIYPTFLQVQRGFDTHTVGLIAIVFNIGAILGGLTFGHLSDKIGRRMAIVIAALCAIPMIWPWAYGSTAVTLAIGAFLIQFFVQGAWGVVPVHLNELSPDAIRGTFPGVVYQLGNLLASANATMQASIAVHNNGDYAYALALVAGIVAVVVAVFAGFGFEAKGVHFGPASTREAVA